MKKFQLLIACATLIVLGLVSGVALRNSDVETFWPEGVSVVRIKSSVDGTIQKARFFSAQSSRQQPLVVSLHTWSGDYDQKDPLAEKAKNSDWNYIHPDFRGPNRRADACLSDKVMSDIDDAIQFAIDNGSVDLQNIFVVGASGGGHAALGAYMRTRHNIRAFLAWVPISDLEAWYWQSKYRRSTYADDIVACTSANDTFNIAEALKRSPLHWEMPPTLNGRLEMYAGVNDGYSDSVPISHSILFFNKVVEHVGKPSMFINQDEMIECLTRGIPEAESNRKMEGRAVLYSRDAEQVSLIIFDGGHEILSDYCFNRMIEIAASGKR
jgi:pimeloyl-ACP methyl ester carboxylesterase